MNNVAMPRARTRSSRMANLHLHGDVEGAGRFVAIRGRAERPSWRS